MHRRLARALVEKMAHSVGDGGGAWLLIEGVDADLAQELSLAWRPDLPTLVIKGPADRNFGVHALRDSSATALRNSAPLCLVLCEGQYIDDYQSVRNFDRYSPSDLIADQRGIDLLARQSPDA